MSEQHYDPDILARRLDQALPAHKSFIPPITPDPLVNTAAEVAKLILPSLSTQASSRIEAHMLATFDEQYRPRIVERSRRMPSVLRWSLVASLVLVVLLIASLTPAVASSLPGEPLYQVKQFYEKVELSTAFTSAAKANVYLEHASRRAQEALTLLDRNQFDPELLTAALSNINEAGKSANEVRASARLRGQVLQVDALVNFVLENAQESALTSPSDVASLINQSRQIANSDLMQPLPVILPSATLTPTETPTPTLSPTEEVTEFSSPVSVLGSDGITPTCEHGQSCLSQGVPGGQVVPPTLRPTNVHRNPPPTPHANPGGGNSSGNAQPTPPNNPGGGNTNNGGGNTNGGGDSAGGNSNGGGNGNGKGGG